jgi:hypothetical protein
MKTRLTVLEELRIATPCNADWDDMNGDERVRFCGKCEKNVYNLSAMSRADAEALVREKEQRLCVRFYQRADGTVLTGDCPVGVQKKRLRQRVWASLSGAAASLMLLLGLSAGRARADLTLRDGKRPANHHAQMMGGPAPSPPPMLMGEPVAVPQHPLMGKPTLPKTKPERAMPMMGDVSIDH